VCLRAFDTTYPLGNKRRIRDTLLDEVHPDGFCTLLGKRQSSGGISPVVGATPDAA
jgi:hypothetical protein